MIFRPDGVGQVTGKVSGHGLGKAHNLPAAVAVHRVFKTVCGVVKLGELSSCSSKGVHHAKVVGWSVKVRGIAGTHALNVLVMPLAV